MSHVIATKRVTFIFVILHDENLGHGLADHDQSAELTGPRAFSNLDLHPTSGLVSSEIGTHDIQHVDGKGPGPRLLGPEDRTGQ